MFELINLQVLDLGTNYFSGLVSSDIYNNLISLTYLELSVNANDGRCNRTDGTFINVSSKGLEGDILGSNISKLNKLEEICLDRNNFGESESRHSISPNIGQLTHLKLLSAASNKLLTGTLPTEITNLSNLEQLFLFDNRLIGSIPESIENMKALGESCFLFYDLVEC
jgi:Leucine-rich repeat (LRR) protein